MTHREKGNTRLAGLHAGAAFLTVLITLHAAEAAPGPTDTIRTTADTVISILNDDTLKRSDRLAERVDRIMEAIRPHLDFQEISRRALGAEWGRRTVQEQEQFVELFAELLRDAIASELHDYKGETVEYLSERVEGAYAEVRTRIKGSKVDIPVDFRLRQSQDGTWRAYDMVADGISMVGNYRAQFARILRSSSYADLVAKLKKKIAEPKQYQIITGR